MRLFRSALLFCMRARLLVIATTIALFAASLYGYGFIQQDAGGPDVFVHISAVERSGMRSLVEGQKVTFDVQPDRKTGKSAATNIQPA